MIHRADRFVVVLDANVLYPFRKRDILLRFYAAGLYRARWTERIMDEWTRNLLKEKPDTGKSIQSQLLAIEEAFPESFVEGYCDLIQGLSLPDMDDRHVLAAAIKCGAQRIVTDNLRHFPAKALQKFEIEPIGADDFLCDTLDLYWNEGLAVIHKLRLDYKNPPFTPSELVLDLAGRGLPKLAAMLRDHRASL